MCLCTSFAIAADFRPYPEAKISLEQFEEYQGIIVEEFGGSAVQVSDQNLVVYLDNQKGNYAFTTEGHPAHPSWIARRVVEENGSVNIEQIGYFAGEEKPFASLYQQYRDLNEQIKQGMKK